jgi:hypothetical protein
MLKKAGSRNALVLLYRKRNESGMQVKSDPFRKGLD